MTTLHCPHVLNIIQGSMADFQSVTKFMVWSSRQVVLSDNETPLWFLALQYSGHLNNLFSIDKLNINIEKKQTYMLCLNYSAFKWPATSTTPIYLYGFDCVWQLVLSKALHFDRSCTEPIDEPTAESIFGDRSCTNTYSEVHSTNNMVTDPCLKVHDFAFLCFIAFWF